MPNTDENDDDDKKATDNDAMQHRSERTESDVENYAGVSSFWTDGGSSDDGFDDFFQLDDSETDSREPDAAPLFRGKTFKDYDYTTAFDDHEPTWYRRDSFRYRSRVDYSPSRLFRRTFSSGNYLHYGDNEAKNKAIRALRTLTRNANTIVDARASKANYTVQFSRGDDRNTPEMPLNSQNRQTVFVSPDALLDTTTTEDEDNVVDALTGFVLLRVQLAQVVKPEVIAELNAADLQGVGLHIAQSLEKIDLATADQTALQKISDDAVNYYLAGILAKNVLTRIARRGVVENWGGFAPYFARHIKKFNAVRDTILAAELTLETLVARIAYNLIDDEVPIAVPAFADDIMDKWLGVEIAHEQLLDVCGKIVADLREQLEANNIAVKNDNDIGTKIDAMLAALHQACRAPDELASDAAFLEEYGSAAFDAWENSYQFDAEKQKLINELGAIEAEATLAAIAKKLAKHIENELQKLSTVTAEQAAADDMVAETGVVPGTFDLAELRNRVNSIAENINYHLNSRPRVQKLLRDSGHGAAIDDASIVLQTIANDCVKIELKEIAKACADTRKVSTELLAKIKAVVDATVKPADLEESFKKIEAFIAKLAASMAKAQQELQQTYENLSDDRHANVSENTRNDVYAALTHTIARISCMAEEQCADIAKTLPKNNVSRLKTQTSRAKKLKELLNCARSEHFRQAIADMLPGFPHVAGVAGQIAQKLEQVSRSVDGDFTAVDKPSTVPRLVQEILTGPRPSTTDAAAAVAREFAAGFNDDNIEELTEHYPAFADTLAQAHQTDRAAYYTCSPESRNKYAELKDVANKAAAAGKKISTAMTPVDQELFGEAVSTTTKVLATSALNTANDEANNAQEEDYIAYITTYNDTSAKPAIEVRQEHKRTSATTIVKHICTKYKNFITRIRDALQFQAGKRTQEEYGLLSGDLDEGGLHKLSYDCDHIWAQKSVSKLPDVAVGILVDQSGSMDGEKIEQARTLCIILAEALQKIKGVRLYIYGHTANSGGNRTGLTIYEHYTPAMGTDLAQLGSIAAHYNNYDGYAIKDVAKRLQQDPAKRKYLFVIADGYPSGSGYSGKDAQRHVTSVCKFIRDRLHTGLYAFAVGVPDYEQPAFKQQYGEQNTVFVDNVLTCLPSIVRFLRNTLQKEKQLVAERSD